MNNSLASDDKAEVLEMMPLGIKVEDENPTISLQLNSLPSKSMDNNEVKVREETPEPPVLEFDVTIREESLTPPPLHFNDSHYYGSPHVRVRVESVTPPPLLFDHVLSQKRKADDMGGDDASTNGVLDREIGGNHQEQGDREVDPEGIEVWEEEINEILTPNSDIRDWEALRSQIKADLKKKHKSLSLSQINQLMILRNFANLRLKGFGQLEASFEIAQQWHEKDSSNSHFARRICALARHYQIFEQLPKERRGGYKNAHTLLKNEVVRTASRTWLTDQLIGSITPFYPHWGCLLASHSVNGLPVDGL